MSEPTYRIELTHDPASASAVCWTAKVYAVADDSYAITEFYGASREDAFDRAQTWLRAKSLPPEPGSTVFLTEDGELLDPFDTVQT